MVPLDGGGGVELYITHFSNYPHLPLLIITPYKYTIMILINMHSPLEFISHCISLLSYNMDVGGNTIDCLYR